MSPIQKFEINYHTETRTKNEFLFTSCIGERKHDFHIEPCDKDTTSVIRKYVLSSKVVFSKNT